MNQAQIAVPGFLRGARRFSVAGVLLCLVLGVAGCGTIDTVVAGTRSVVASTRSMVGLAPTPVVPDWKNLVISATDNANADSAVAVDLVLVRDNAVIETLQNMPAAKWFASRTDIQRTFPEALTLYPYELVPAQSIRLTPKQITAERALAVFVFANYATPGEHRARLLLNTEGYFVQLSAQSFKVTELKSGAAK